MLWGAIVGDIVGSVYEFDNIKTKDFPLFSEHGFITDDSCMTIAVADALMRLAARAICNRRHANLCEQLVGDFQI